jgi:cellulose synthase/poly-beta-1,6-N-acetylglucosamine synthase-like glycosyltransferase
MALPALTLDEPPMVSVVCPVRNERATIEGVIAALERQTYPTDRLEIVVVDGASDDGTAEWVRARAVGNEIAIRVVDNPRRVTPVAMNLGIEAAKGDVIVLVGGHTIVADDFVEASVRALAETGAALAGGRVTTVGEGAVARAIAIAQSSRAGVGGVAFRTAGEGAMAVDTVAFGAYRREIFEALGRFDEELVRNQDDEMSFRITQAGGLVWFDSRIRSRYHSRATLRALARQYHQYGLFKVRVIQKRGAVPAPRHLVPAAAVLALTGSVAVGAFRRRPRVPAVVVGAYVGGCVAAGIVEGRRDPAAAPIVPAAIVALHVPYGVGFLQGLWRFRGQWRRRPAPPSRR